MRLITGCLRPTPTELLPVLSGIAPAPLHREHHTYTLVTKALTSQSHLLHDLVEQSNLLGPQRLKSHRPFSRHAVRFVNSQFDICESWNTDWQQVSLPAHSPQHSPTTWHWATKERMGVLESSANWCWSLWCIHVPLGTAAVSSTAQHLMDEFPIFCPRVDLNLCHPGPSTREWLRLLGILYNAVSNEKKLICIFCSLVSHFLTYILYVQVWWVCTPVKHTNTWSFNQLLVLLAVWPGAKSCWKMKSASLKSWSAEESMKCSKMSW